MYIVNRLNCSNLLPIQRDEIMMPNVFLFSGILISSLIQCCDVENKQCNYLITKQKDFSKNLPKK
jgi:hypothetical protein